MPAFAAAPTDDLPTAPEQKFELVSSLTSHLIHSSRPILSLFGLTRTPGIEEINAEINREQDRSRTVTGPALDQSLKRLDRLRSVKGMTEKLIGHSSNPGYLRIDRPDIQRLKRTAVEKLLAGIADLPDEISFDEGKRLFLALERFSGLERNREALKEHIGSFYPGPQADSPLLFRLDFEGLTDADLDPKKYPALESIQKLPFLVAYRSLRDSEDPLDEQTAGYVEELFEHFREGNWVGPQGGEGPLTSDPVAHVNSLSDVMEGFLTDPRREIFFDRIKKTQWDAAETDAERAPLRVGEGLEALPQYPTLTKTLEGFKAQVSNAVPPIPLEDQKALLTNICKFLVERGDRSGWDVSIAADYEDSVLIARDVLTTLESPDPVTQEALNNVADKLAPVGVQLQVMEGDAIRRGFEIMITEIEKIPATEGSEGGSTDPLWQALDEISGCAADPQKAYGELAAKIQLTGTVRVVEARLKLIENQILTIDDSAPIVLGFSSMARGRDERAAAKNSERAVKTWINWTRPRLADLEEMQGQYRAVLALLKTTAPDKTSNVLLPKPADQWAKERVQRGLQLFARMEGIRQHDILQDMAAKSDEVSQIATQTFTVAVILISTAALCLPAIPVAGGTTAAVALEGPWRPKRCPSSD
jgi:hypothetical protein